MDKNKLIQYLIANMGHSVHQAVNSLKASGKLPREAKAADFWEHGIHGLMQAIHNYDPNRGDLNAYAKKKIMGLIQEHVKADRNAYVPRSLESDARAHAQIPGSEVAAMGQSSRGAVESAGGNVDESGAANLSSVKNFDRQFADKNQQFVGSDKFKDKMARYERDYGEKPTPSPSPSPTPAQTPAVSAAPASDVPAAPAKPVVVRRPAMKPEQEQRLKAIDAAKTSQGKK